VSRAARTPPRRARSPQFGHAARVALAATVLIGVVYLGCAVVVDQVVADRLVSAVDSRLGERLSDALAAARRDPGPAAGTRPGRSPQSGPLPGHSRPGSGEAVDEVPAFVWRASPGHAPVALSAGTPLLPGRLAPAAGQHVTVHLGGSVFRLAAIRQGSSRLVAGQSLADQQHIQDMLRDGAALAAPVLLLAMFAGSLIIGLRALSPVEQSRRRQLEFTADASHELRTPLSVINAEIGIALSAPREAADYRAVLLRIQDESGRLRRIVEDLLWLARFDSAPPPPGDEPLDLTTVARECAQRFQAVAQASSPGISVTFTPSQAAWISAPPEWIDRLTGVLVDNACRYAGPGGSVRLSVAARGGRVSLTVEDSGPGIPPGQRDRLFDRFQRATEHGAGTGLGLAIADSITASTGGHWRIGESGLGGALFEVSWRRPLSRVPAGPPAQAAPPAPAEPPERPERPDPPERPASLPAQPGTGSPAR
jgi:two-component system sensor histidine kinase CiaH